MKFGILHLSDLHISSDRDKLFSQVELIKSAINPRITEQLAVILAYTGDIAFSGKAEEYEAAYHFHGNLLAALSQIPKVQILGTVGIPGNHDCDFSAAGDARPVLLSSVGSNIESVNLEGESIQQLAKVQSNFFAFLQKLNGGHQVDAGKRLYWSAALNWMGKRIIVQCLNTAVTSRLKEQPGQLYFPVQAVPDEAPDAEYVATLLHHPYGWLEPGNARELRRRVESTSDIVLSGHEHDSDSYLRVSRSGDETNYIEGGALQSSGDTCRAPH